LRSNVAQLLAKILEDENYTLNFYLETNASEMLTKKKHSRDIDDFYATKRRDE